MAAALAISALLTCATIWAVYAQSRALRARDWTDLLSAAQAAATVRTAEFQSQVDRDLRLAARLWESSGRDGLDTWALGEPRWLMVGYLTNDDVWQVFPRTPLEERRGQAPADDVGPMRSDAELRGTLSYLEELARDSDPLLRAGALLAAAAVEQQLGNPLAAARGVSTAAHLLTGNPRVSRLAFHSELTRVSDLRTDGDLIGARQALADMVTRLRDEHPARLGPLEVERLRLVADQLDVATASETGRLLADLGARAERRADIARELGQRIRAEQGAADARRVFTLAVGAPLIVCAESLANGTHLVVTAPVADVLRRYWRSPAEGAVWNVRPAGAVGSEPVLLELGPEFGHARLETSAEAGGRLRALDRRQAGLIAATALGSAGAWTLVLWMLARTLRHQRELVRLQRRFVADVSHELKTPLALIRLLAETLAGQRVRDPEKVRGYLETITRESERLSVLLDSILDFSRLESGKKRFEFADCDVGQVARQAWALFEAQFARDGFDARLEVAEDLPIIRADGQSLQQVMVNLLQNAHRYAGDGKYVRLSVRRDGYLVIIAVEDHGVGMSRQQLDRLGDSFVRGDDTQVRQMRGTGLGLAIVDHIVAAHQGKLEVQSRPGEGSTFSVWLPFDPPDEEPSA